MHTSRRGRSQSAGALALSPQLIRARTLPPEPGFVFHEACCAAQHAVAKAIKAVLTIASHVYAWAVGMIEGGGKQQGQSARCMAHPMRWAGVLCARAGFQVVPFWAWCGEANADPTWDALCEDLEQRREGTRDAA